MPETKPETASSRAITSNKGAGAGNEASPAREEVAHRAYMIWLECGCPHGEHETHWRQAEDELRKKPT